MIFHLQVTVGLCQLKRREMANLYDIESMCETFCAKCSVRFSSAFYNRTAKPVTAI